MLTLFSVPKPFCGHIGMIQLNALQSWLLLRPRCEVMLFGKEDGTAEVADRFGVSHSPEVLLNEFGTPLLNDLFDKAQKMANHNLMCYVNADIILNGDFTRSVEQIRRLRREFLLAGRRWNVDLAGPIDFDQPDWEDRLRSYVRRNGALSPYRAIDYFVFPRGLFRDLPPFAIGRPGFDNWLLWRARALGASLVDASEAIMAVHQNHDYSHHPQGRAGVWDGPEARRNRELMGGKHHFFTLADATWCLTANELKRNLSFRYFRRKWKFARRSAHSMWRRLVESGKRT